MDWSSPEGKAILDKVRNLCASFNFDPAKSALKLGSLASLADTTDLKTALEIVLARHRAARLGPWAAEALLTSQSAQQASRLEIAERHASRFRGLGRVLEIGTGAGADAAAISRVAEQVVSIEASSELAAMARHNLDLQGANNVEILVGKAEDVLPTLNLAEFDGLFSDPSRRDAKGERIKDPALYGPSLEFLTSLPIHGPRGIKISPAVNLSELPAGFVREFLGAGDECLEQTLWAGANLADGAVFLADAGEAWAPPETSDEADCLADDDEPGGFILEPHPLIVRTGAFRSWLKENGARLLGENISLGVAQFLPPPSGLFWAFETLESAPFDPKATSSRLKELLWTNKTEIKTRNIFESPEEVRARLKLPPSSGAKDPSATLFVLRRGRKYQSVLARRISGEKA